MSITQAEGGTVTTSNVDDNEELKQWLESVGFETLYEPMVQAEWNSLDLLIGLDTTDKDLDGLIPDLTKNIKLSNPQKIRLKRAIQKLQTQNGFENGNMINSPANDSNNNNNNTNSSGDNNTVHLMKYVNNDEVKSIEKLSNHINSINKTLDILMDQCDKIEKCESATKLEIENVFLQVSQELEKRKKYLLDKSSEYYKSEMNKIQLSMETIKNSLNKCEKTKEECSKLLTKGIKIEDLSKRTKQIQDDINTCIEDSNKVDNSNGVIKNFQIKSNFHCDNDDLVNKIKQFGIISIWDCKININETMQYIDCLEIQFDVINDNKEMFTIEKVEIVYKYHARDNENETKLSENNENSSNCVFAVNGENVSKNGNNNYKCVIKDISSEMVICGVQIRAYFSFGNDSNSNNQNNNLDDNKSYLWCPWCHEYNNITRLMKWQDGSFNCWETSKEYIGERMEVTGQYDTIISNCNGRKVKTSGLWNTAAMKECIDPRTMKQINCKLKIIQINDASTNSWQTIAGVIIGTSAAIPATTNMGNAQGEFGFVGGISSLSNNSVQTNIEGIGTFINLNDELDVRIDLTNHQLHCQTNGNGFYKVADLPRSNEKMRIALSLCHGYTVEIISYSVK